MSNIIAGPGVQGKTCPYCQTPIKPGEQATVCDSCGIPHHGECWQHNGGCTTFGCRSACLAPAGFDSQQPMAWPPQYAQQPYPSPYWPPQTYSNVRPLRRRTIAGLLAICLGWLGIHKFYLGKWGLGFLYLIFFWTYIPAIVGLVEGIIYLCMSDAEFVAKYGYR